MAKKSYKKNKNRLESEDFEQIKLLVDKKFKPTQIEEITGWSNNVINEVRKANAYGEYVQLMRERNAQSVIRRNGISASTSGVSTGPSVSDSLTGYQTQKLEVLNRIAHALENLGERG